MVKKVSRGNSLPFKLAMKRIKQDVAPNTELTEGSVFLLNSLAVNILNRLTESTNDVAKYEKKTTLKERHARAAAKLALRGSLSKFADKAGSKALKTYSEAVAAK